MGVRGLTSLLKEQTSALSTHVNISKKPATSTVEAPLTPIIIDGNAFVYWLCGEELGNKAAVCTDYSILASKAQGWYNRALHAGLKCVFIFDGPTESAKLRTRLQRVQQQAADLHTFGERFNAGSFQLRHVAASLSSVPPCLSISCIIETLLHLECDVFFSHGEADAALVLAAREYGAIGVLSNDSDILVYNVDGIHAGFIPFWAFGFDESGIAYAYVFTAERLSALFEIDVKCLPLLAVLAGNDYSTPELLWAISAALFHPTPLVRQGRSSRKKKAKKSKPKKKSPASASTATSTATTTGVSGSATSGPLSCDAADDAAMISVELMGNVTAFDCTNFDLETTADQLRKVEYKESAVKTIKAVVDLLHQLFPTQKRNRLSGSPSVTTREAAIDSASASDEHLSHADTVRELMIDLIAAMIKCPPDYLIYEAIDAPDATPTLGRLLIDISLSSKSRTLARGLCAVCVESINQYCLSTRTVAPADALLYLDASELREQEGMCYSELEMVRRDAIMVPRLSFSVSLSARPSTAGHTGVTLIAKPHSSSSSSCSSSSMSSVSMQFEYRSTLVSNSSDTFAFLQPLRKVLYKILCSNSPSVLTSSHPTEASPEVDSAVLTISEIYKPSTIGALHCSKCDIDLSLQSVSVDSKHSARQRLLGLCMSIQEESSSLLDHIERRMHPHSLSPSSVTILSLSLLFSQITHPSWMLDDLHRASLPNHTCPDKIPTIPGDYKQAASSSAPSKSTTLPVNPAASTTPKATAGSIKPTASVGKPKADKRARLHSELLSNYGQLIAYFASAVSQFIAVTVMVHGSSDIEWVKRKVGHRLPDSDGTKGSCMAFCQLWAALEVCVQHLNWAIDTLNTSSHVRFQNRGHVGASIGCVPACVPSSAVAISALDSQLFACVLHSCSDIPIVLDSSTSVQTPKSIRRQVVDSLCSPVALTASLQPLGLSAGVVAASITDLTHLQRWINSSGI